MEVMYSAKESYEAIKNDSEKGARISYEEMKCFYDSKSYSIEVPVEKHLEVEMESMDTILPHLYERDWHMIITNKETGYFITTDRPVILNWIEPEITSPGILSEPGFGLKQTRVFFPLSKTHAVVGEFGGPKYILPATRELVASFNTCLLYTSPSPRDGLLSRMPSSA